MNRENENCGGKKRHCQDCAVNNMLKYAYNSLTCFHKFPSGFGTHIAILTLATKGFSSINLLIAELIESVARTQQEYIDIGKSVI